MNQKKSSIIKINLLLLSVLLFILGLTNLMSLTAKADSTPPSGGLSGNTSLDPTDLTNGSAISPFADMVSVTLKAGEGGSISNGSQTGTDFTFSVALGTQISIRGRALDGYEIDHYVFNEGTPKQRITTISEEEHYLTLRLIYSPAEDTNISFYFRKIPKTVAFYQNFGSPEGLKTISTKAVVVDAQLDLESLYAQELGAPTRPGYTFTGWYNLRKGGIRYDKDHLYTVKSDSNQVYAHWEANTYTLSFDLNDPSGTANGKPEDLQIKTDEITVLSSSSSIQRPGYRFVGWTADPDVLPILPYNYIMQPNDVTLYAYWQSEIRGQVYLDANRDGTQQEGETLTDAEAYSVLAYTAGTNTLRERGKISADGSYLFYSLKEGEQIEFAFVLSNSNQYRFTYGQDGSDQVSFAPYRTAAISITKEGAKMPEVGLVTPFLVQYIADYGESPEGFTAFEGDHVPLNTTGPSDLETAQFGYWALSNDIKPVPDKKTYFDELTFTQEQRAGQEVLFRAWYSAFLVTGETDGHGSADINGNGSSTMVANGGTATVLGTADLYYVVNEVKNETTGESREISKKEQTSLREPFPNITEPTVIKVGFIGRKVQLSFDTQGGNALSPIQMRYTETLSLAPYLPGGSLAPQKADFRLLGWSLSPSGENQLLPDSYPVPGEDTILYAQWAARNYTIRFDVNGGSQTQSPPEITAPAGSKIDLSAYQAGAIGAPSRKGFGFLGWTDPAGVPALNTYTVPSGDSTLQAQWLDYSKYLPNVIDEAIRTHPTRHGLTFLGEDSFAMYRGEYTKEEASSAFPSNVEYTGFNGATFSLPLRYTWDDSILLEGGIGTALLYGQDPLDGELFGIQKEFTLYVLNRPYILVRKDNVSLLDDGSKRISEEMFGAAGYAETPNLKRKRIEQVRIPLYFSADIPLFVPGEYSALFSGNYIDFREELIFMQKSVGIHIRHFAAENTEEQSQLLLEADSSDFWVKATQILHQAKKGTVTLITPNNIGNGGEILPEKTEYDQKIIIQPGSYLLMNPCLLDRLKQDENTLLVIETENFSWTFHSKDSFLSNRVYDPKGYFDLNLQESNNEEITKLAGDQAQIQLTFQMNRPWFATPIFRLKIDNPDLLKEAENGANLYLFHFNPETKKLELVGNVLPVGKNYYQVEMKEVFTEYIILAHLPPSLHTIRITENTTSLDPKTSTLLGKNLYLAPKESDKLFFSKNSISYIGYNALLEKTKITTTQLKKNNLLLFILPFSLTAASALLLWLHYYKKKEKEESQ